MSVENFYQTHPADPERLKDMMKRKQEEGELTMSLVALLAEDLAYAGGEGLRQVTNRLDSSHTTLAPDSISHAQLSRTDQKAVSDNLAAVILGISIIGIEEALISRTMDIAGWCSRYDNAISGTPLKKAVFLGQDREVLTDQQWHQMIVCAGQDKTLSAFFDRDFASLPNSMKGMLAQQGRLDAINQILPNYQERACLLVV